METAVSACTPRDDSRLAHLSARSRHMLVRTLLFLGAVGLDHTWDLRSYTGDALGVLTDRSRAYGYFHTERFLSQVAQADGAETFTDGLAQWTARLWKPPVASTQEVEPLYYIDGHRKPVYADALIPRGLIGNSGKILGCRALVLLHDEQGHPRLATTHRGDQHLTVGVPAILTRYEQATGKAAQARIIVDRDQMAAQFLADLVAAGRTVVTVLRTDQYANLESFTEVGAFVPLEHDRQGKLIREVAAACFALPLPDQPGASLPLQVALVRDLRRQVPCKPEEEPPRRWDADLDLLKQAWWEDDWQASPTPVTPTTAKLIPIVTTAATADAVTLAQTYGRRWPAQENIIRDYLLALGLDTNHGYAKTAVVNSEVAKRRTALEQRLATLRRWTASARVRYQHATALSDRLRKQAKARGETLYRGLNERMFALEEQGMADYLVRREIKERKATIDTELQGLWQRIYRVEARQDQDWRKQERYCRKPREVLRALEDLASKEREMFELDKRKDQVMTVCKVALVNLVMWTRDQYFPLTYAQATWKRLAPFFHLPGRVTRGPRAVSVELRPFNDRQLNHDLVALCELVNQASPQLPDGRQLLFSVSPVFDRQQRRPDCTPSSTEEMVIGLKG